MDFFVNALGDVFAWVFLISSGLATLLAMVTLAAVAGALIGLVSWSTLLGAGALTIEAALVALLTLAGDYVQRIYRQSSGRPFYLVRRVHEAIVPSAAAIDRPGARG